ncbi:type I restriction enzyme HsdR N-terminal domain-containing protein [Flavobacterium orientale]|uniref:Restriction endonuclease subunit R n=1 Tax=Flavobacterium orientale TaxID=1756020 RepID=A0A917DE72_9FLAO|nr:type I restriction enzyme HsdR N-terminal domain-containing protein [Flavobacterium orientale]GGD31043.1 restriction endonuclease subunit R [Flavobacterium orientale]
MQKLNFPVFNFRFKNSENKVAIFDEIRKKFVLLTPEEWVRQHVVHYLISVKKHPKTLINVEKKVLQNGISKRYDVVAFRPDGSIYLVIECKAPEVKLSQKAFDQLAQYNFILNATYLMVTNGLNHYFCEINVEQSNYNFLTDIPEFNLNQFE